MGHFSQLGHLSIEQHRERCQILSSIVFGEENRLRGFKKGIIFLTVEDILASNQIPQDERDVYAQRLEAVRTSDLGRNFEQYEKRAVEIVKLPFGDRILEIASLIYRPQVT